LVAFFFLSLSSFKNSFSWYKFCISNFFHNFMNWTSKNNILRCYLQNFAIQTFVFKWFWRNLCSCFFFQFAFFIHSQVVNKIVFLKSRSFFSKPKAYQIVSKFSWFLSFQTEKKTSDPRNYFACWKIQNSSGISMLNACEYFCSAMIGNRLSKIYFTVYM
jgi:ABC-type multidrug transport system fused ATPase/permease subunit